MTVATLESRLESSQKQVAQLEKALRRNDEYTEQLKSELTALKCQNGKVTLSENSMTADIIECKLASIDVPDNCPDVKDPVKEDHPVLFSLLQDNSNAMEMNANQEEMNQATFTSNDIVRSSAFTCKLSLSQPLNNVTNSSQQQNSTPDDNLCQVIDQSPFSQQSSQQSSFSPALQSPFSQQSSEDSLFVKQPSIQSLSSQQSLDQSQLSQQSFEQSQLSQLFDNAQAGGYITGNFLPPANAEENKFPVAPNTTPSTGLRNLHISSSDLQLSQPQADELDQENSLGVEFNSDPLSSAPLNFTDYFNSDVVLPSSFSSPAELKNTSFSRKLKFEENKSSYPVSTVQNVDIIDGMSASNAGFQLYCRYSGRLKISCKLEVFPY